MLRCYFLLVLLISNVSVCMAVEPAEKSVLRVAVVLGLTGSASLHSLSIRKGIELAEDQLRKEGVSVELLYEDDQTNPGKTVSAFRSLLARGYTYFIGPTWSFQAKAAIPILARSQAIAILPVGSSLINGGSHRNVFNLCPRRDRQEPVLAHWLRPRQDKRGFILTPPGDWGEIHRQVFGRSLKQSGGTVVGEELFDYGADLSTLKSLLLKAKKAGTTMVFTTGSAADVANIVKAHNQLKLAMNIVSTDDIRDAVKLGLLTLQDVESDVYSLYLPASEEFKKLYRMNHGGAPPLYADRGYDALMVLAEAFMATDGSAGAMRDFIGHQLDYQGVTGRIRFDNNGDVMDGRYLFSSVSNNQPAG